jgi:hypothetical protein
MDQSFANKFRDRFKSKLASDLSTSKLITSDVDDKSDQHKQPTWFADRKSRVPKTNTFASTDSNMQRVRSASRRQMEQFLSELASSTPMQDDDVKMAESRLEQEFDFFVRSEPIQAQTKPEVPVMDAIKSRYQLMSPTESILLHFPTNSKVRSSVQVDEDDTKIHICLSRITLDSADDSVSADDVVDDDILGIQNVNLFGNFDFPQFVPKTQIIEELQVKSTEQEKVTYDSQMADDELDKNQAKLKVLVQKYQEFNLASEIDKLNAYLVELDEQIENLECELNDLNASSDTSPLNLNVNDLLLQQKASALNQIVQEALQTALKRQLLVIGRRKNLLSILNTWKIINDSQNTGFDDMPHNKKGKKNMKVMLKMTEQTSNNLEEEERQLQQLINQHVRLEMLMQRLSSSVKDGLKSKWFGKLTRFNKTDHGKSEAQLNSEVRAQTFLLDGRLPGEPIFSDIRLKDVSDELLSSENVVTDESTSNLDTSRQKAALADDQLQMFAYQTTVKLDERQKTLRLRNLNDIEQVKVPLYDRELPLMNIWQGKLDPSEQSPSTDGDQSAKANDLLRQIELRLMKSHRLRSQMQIESTESAAKARYYRHEDLVCEPPESIRNTFDLSRFFSSKLGRRPLQAVRANGTDQRSSASGQLKRPPPLASDQTQWIQIRVRQAMNVPMRSHSSTAASSLPWPTSTVNTKSNQLSSRFAVKVALVSASNVDKSLDSVQVRPFVEFTFRRTQVRTRCAFGNTPAWNESLAFDLGRQHLQAKEQLLLNLFDQVDEGQSTESRQWLGCVRLPLLSLLTSGRIEGTFRILTNPVQSAYDQYTSSQQLLQLPIGPIHTTAATSPPPSCTISIVIRLEPRSPAPLPDSLPSLDSIEPPLLIDFARRWQQQQRDLHSGRPIRCISLALPDRKLALCCRFLAPLRPPDTLLIDLQPTSNQLHVLLGKVSRFTASIPRRVDAHQIAWASCDQILTLNLASDQERAILLCCFFLYLGRQSAVALGEDCTSGSACAFVLVWNQNRFKSQWSVMGKDNQTVQLWHANTGVCYTLNHSRQLPAVSVHTVFTSDNVFANIQKSDQPLQIKFDLSISTDWKPLLVTGTSSSKSFASSGILPSLQPATFVYAKPDERFVSALEAQLESHLKEKLMTWRKQNRTFFNRDLGRKAKQWLSLMEAYTTDRMAAELSDDSSPVQALQGATATTVKTVDPISVARTNWSQMLDVYQVRDMIYNQCLDQTSELVDILFASGLHLAEHRQTDFVLAVHLHAFTDSVMTVWLYFAALIRKDHI